MFGYAEIFMNSIFLKVVEYYKIFNMKLDSIVSITVISYEYFL